LHFDFFSHGSHLHDKKMKEWLVSYLSFSKKERTGIIVLVVLILTIWLLPEYFREPASVDPKLLTLADSLVRTEGAKMDQQKKPSRLFYFDPNKISDTQWEELGINRKTVSIIRNYLQKGGQFRESADLEKIYGMRKQDAERLAPFVKIERGGQSRRLNFSRPAIERTQEREAREKFQNYTRRSFQKQKMVIDINGADSIGLEALPGIGVKLASRIIRFREALGGFHRVEQLSDVYGIDDTLFNLIQPSVILGAGIYRKVRINHWDADSLDMHPYIQKHEAKAIVKYRGQHGRFNDADELSKIGFITSDWIDRIRPYLDLD
jgi:competence protein ComEA